MVQFLSLLPKYSLNAAGFPLIDGLLSLSTNPEDFSSWFVRVGVSIGGGLAVILVTSGSYKLLTSGGDPAKIKDGKDQIQNAILGFLLIIMAVGIISLLFGFLGLGSIVNFTH